jgi:glutathione synthase/RimK-type ligase-like ATP-grasp enzyme
LFLEFETPEIVVKPIVGANADDTFWLRRDDRENRWRDAINVFANRTLIAQPMVQSVCDVGEYSLFYFAGLYSHAILKTPKSGDFRVQEEHGGLIQSVRIDRDLKKSADEAVQVIESEFLYARVDLVRLADGTPALMELELVEPSLYFPFDEESPRRFAVALDQMSKE